MSPFKNVWTWLVGIILFLLAALKIANNKNAKLGAELDLKDTEIKSNEIDSKLNVNSIKYKELEAKKQELKEKNPSLNVSNLSPEEIESYWSED